MCTLTVLTGPGDEGGQGWGHTGHGEGQGAAQESQRQGLERRAKEAEGALQEAANYRYYRKLCKGLDRLEAN